jgi:hypothetical protein
MYFVTFVPTKKDFEKVKALLSHLEKKDKTFSYSQTKHFLFFEDNDKKRAFRRAMWLKETLAEEQGIDIEFTISKYKGEK